MGSEETVLEEAARLVEDGGERQHGRHPAETFGRIAALWSAYLGLTITPRQVAMLMVLLKVGRDASQEKRDNLVDIAGYARNAERLGEKKALGLKDIIPGKITPNTRPVEPLDW